MLIIFDTLKKIIGTENAKSIIKILVNDFSMYITTEEMQQINIVL